MIKTMDKMWGDSKITETHADHTRGLHFRKGRYGLFLHWGLYSELGGKWNGKTYYGIGEWIMHSEMAGIPVSEYMEIAKRFNPDQFDAHAIVQLAKDAGMTYIVITSKHHEGFAMFQSAHPFNSVDASPFHRDPMKELSEACRELGLGFGVYYSHYQDWTAPGGFGGPSQDAEGHTVSFDQYFWEKCYLQVKEICTQYGPLELVWFDTPGNMPKEHVVALHDLIRSTQPNALLGSRIGYGMGDYESLGDMEVPPEKVEGLWEGCDTTNDSWAYAWYDTNWKPPQEILRRLVATVARGGNYLLNIGPDGKGRIPVHCEEFLKQAGNWLHANPAVIRGAASSPWRFAMPWGDITTQGRKTLNLVVFDVPEDRFIYLPGLSTPVKSAVLFWNGAPIAVPAVVVGKSVRLKLPDGIPHTLAIVIHVELMGPAEVEQTQAIHPNTRNVVLAHFAEVSGATKQKVLWMEKFGEWKHVTQIFQWAPGSCARWSVNILESGPYQVSLKYRGKGRLTWKITTDEGALIQNQQAATSQYQAYPMGLFDITKAGLHQIEVELVEGDPVDSSLEGLVLTMVR